MNAGMIVTSQSPPNVSDHAYLITFDSICAVLVRRPYTVINIDAFTQTDTLEHETALSKMK
jgi:hypothetical protein